MHTAFCLVSLDGNTPVQAAEEIRAIRGVREAHATMGEFDVVVMVCAHETREIPRIAEAVRRVHGVVRVVTCVVVGPRSHPDGCADEV